MSIARNATFVLLSSLVLLLTGSVAFADGATIYKERCASCHGADGKADTAVAKMMPVPALTDPKIQAMSASEISAKLKEAAKHPAPVKSLSDGDAALVGEFVKTLGTGAQAN